MQVDVIDLVSRWLHILPAIVLVGGSAFIRFVLLPAMPVVNDADRDALHARIVGTWKFFVHASIGLLLVTGFYNYIHKIQVARPVAGYHMFIGVKIILALVVMFIASALVGRSKGLEPLRAARKQVLTVNLILATLVIMIAGYVKVVDWPRKPDVKPAIVEGSPK